MFALDGLTGNLSSYRSATGEPCEQAFIRAVGAADSELTVWGRALVCSVILATSSARGPVVELSCVTLRSPSRRRRS